MQLTERYMFRLSVIMPTSLKLFDVFAILRRMMYAFLQSDGYKYQCDVIRSWWNRLYYNTNMQRLEMTKMLLDSERLLYKHWYQWQRPQRKNIRAQRIRIWSLNRNSALPRATTKKKKKKKYAWTVDCPRVGNIIVNDYHENSEYFDRHTGCCE